ncbi:MAG TPA: MFS transporter [Trebonia sp.]|jgi:MFS family permease
MKTNAAPALLSDRRIRLFYLASAVSAVGDDALYMALAVWVKQLTGSTSLAGLDICAVAAGMLFAPVTGVLVDRCRRLPLLIRTHLCSTALVLLLLLVSGPGQVWLIIGVTFCYGLTGTIGTGAVAALVKDIVPGERLAEANGIEQTLLQGMRLLTPAAGVGVLVWLGGHAVAVLDAVTFLAAIGLLLLIRIVEQPPALAKRQHWARELAVGLRYTARTPALRQTTVAYAIAFLVFGVCVPLVLQVITEGLHHPASWLGVLTTVEGIGGAIGGVLAARVARRTGDRALMIWGLFALALLTAAFAVPVLAVVGVAMAGFGFFISWFFVGGSTTRQKHTPRELMGRVYGAVSLVMQASQAAGNALGALLILLMPYQRLAYLSAGALAVAAVYLAASQPQRSGRPSMAHRKMRCSSADPA